MLLATGGLLAGTLAAGVGAYENYRNVRIAHGQTTPRITELNQPVNSNYGRPRVQTSNAKPLWSNTNSKKTASHPIPSYTTSGNPTKYRNIPMSSLKQSVSQVRGNRYFRNRVIRYVRRTPFKHRRRRRFSKKKQ